MCKFRCAESDAFGFGHAALVRVLWLGVLSKTKTTSYLDIDPTLRTVNSSAVFRLASFEFFVFFLFADDAGSFGESKFVGNTLAFEL